MNFLLATERWEETPEPYTSIPSALWFVQYVLQCDRCMNISMCPSEISDWALDQLTSSTCDTSFDDIISLACLVMYKSLSLIHLSSSDPLHPTLSPPGPHSLRSRAFTSNQRALLPIRPSIPSAAARIGLPGGHFPVSRDAPAVSSSVISSILVDLGVAGDFNVLDETYDLLSNVTSVTSHSYGGYYGGHNMMRGR